MARKARAVNLGLVILVFFFHTLLVAVSIAVPALTERCEVYDHKACEKNRSQCSPQIQECGRPDAAEKRAHCYVLWSNTTNGGVQILMKGCWLDHLDCYNKEKCVEQRDKGVIEERKADGGHFYCCCEGNFCNQKIFYEPQPKAEEPLPVTLPPEQIKPNPLLSTLLYSLVPVVCFSVVLCVAFWMYRARKLRNYQNEPTEEHLLPHIVPEPVFSQPVELLEVKAAGRFGAVWKAKTPSSTIAVKIFPMQDRESWHRELEIYSLPRMQEHENILRFIGAKTRGESEQMEMWLITTYHPPGSLCDYLKSNVITWEDLCRLASTMACGLAFLHEEFAPNNMYDYKPSVAHRDFKSKNVLVRSDMTACVADFGLAMVFQRSRNPGDVHAQVGTRRYMSPEVLEGAINFSRDAFLRIDMYACGLVLWELASRCTAADGPVEVYQLPYEEEVGLHPLLEDMQDVVAHKKQRPAFRDAWGKHEGLVCLMETIEECWDHDAEARLSARCVQERIGLLPSVTTTTTTTPLIIPPPPTNAVMTNNNNLVTSSQHAPQPQQLLSSQQANNRESIL